MLKSPSEIPNPIQGSIAVFRNLDGAVYYKNPNGSIAPTDFIHDRYKISNPKFTEVLNYTDENIVVERRTPEEYIFKLSEVQQAVTTMGMSGGRGPRGLTGPIGPQGPAGPQGLPSEGAFHIWDTNTRLNIDQSDPDIIFAGPFSTEFAVPDFTGTNENRVTYHNNTDHIINLSNLQVKVQEDTLDVDTIVTVRIDGVDTPLLVIIPAGTVSGTTIENNIDIVSVPIGTPITGFVSYKIETTGATFGHITLPIITTKATPI